MKLFVLIAACAVAAGNALADPASAEGPRIVNVTSDSAPGWIPTRDDEERAVRAAMEYLAANDEGRPNDAYALMSGVNQSLETPAQHAERVGRFNSQAGRNLFHHVVKITWTKDPPQAPYPGIYAAIDIVSRYANVDRDCGYLVMYQAPDAHVYVLMREEINFLANATAAQIAREHSEAEVDRLWAQLSANCPNYVAQPSGAP